MQDYPAPFLDFARWLFLGTLAFAPWAFGATHPDEELIVARLLLSATAFWLLGHALAKRWPRVPFLPCFLLLLLLGQGWWMTLNAHAVLDPEFGRFAPVPAPFEDLPGSMNRIASWSKMLLYTGLAGGFCMACDLAQERRWRSRLMLTIALVGTSVILYGMVLRLFGIRKILWQDGLPGHTWPFATYLYHGNAGAFINLIVPFVAALTVLRFEKSGNHLQRAAWLSALAICAAAIVVNASKAAMVIGGLEVLLLVGWTVRVMARRELEMNWRTIAVYLTVVVSAFVAVAWSVGWEMSAERWSELGAQLNEGNLRLLAHQAALRACGDAGYFGFGPGTFAGVFPYYTSPWGGALAGTWSDAHEDYLQTLMDWGKIGATLWSLLLFGGILAGVWTVLRGRRLQLSPSALSMCWVAVVSLLGLTLHALVDFPLQIASLQLYTITMLGICWGSRRWSIAPKKPPRPVKSTSPKQGSTPAEPLTSR